MDIYVYVLLFEKYLHTDTLFFDMIETCPPLSNIVELNIETFLP